MNAPRDLDWVSANQQLLVAEFARLRALLGETDCEPKGTQANDELATARQHMFAPAAIDHLASLFGLSPFERDVLLLCAGVEMDARIAAHCAQARTQPQGPWASFGLALAVLNDPHWSALTPQAPLRRLRLVELDESAGLTRARLRIDERVLHYIGGLNQLDPRLQAMIEPIDKPGMMSPAHRAAAEDLAARLACSNAPPGPVLLSGDDALGQQDVAATIAHRLGMRLFRLHAAEIPSAAHEQAALASLWLREAALLGGALLITHDDGDALPALSRFIARLDDCVPGAGLTLTAGRVFPNLEVAAERLQVNRPDAGEQRQLWQQALGPHTTVLDGTITSLAGQYRLGARRIAQIARDIAHGDSDRAASDPDANARWLHRACHFNGAEMPDLAQRIIPHGDWTQLILPAAQRQTLEQIAIHAKHRLTVLHDWGFASQSARGLGIASLFWGDSGTGKSFAAEVLAHSLGLALYRIDLSAVVSKYIGETEKNLRRLFDAAESLGAVLLFDEADALFGKRSEVRDSHDRYANIEVSYLLQRMEAYCGIAILTTNHKAALDTAFARRLRFVVHFPFPDTAQREAIWRTTFPAGVPLGQLDYTRLANLAVPGGTIRNIALTAAFLAAEAGAPVSMGQLRHAAHLEAAKRDKPFSDAETRGWA